MLRKKSFWKRFKKSSEGVISILLSIALLPFFSLAAILIEGGRYQNSVKALDAAIGSSAVSTLSEYESYLYDRFGVLAVRQTNSDSLIGDEVSRYLALQKTTDMKGVALDKVTAQGVYPLSDTAVLKQQVMDYGSVLAPARIALDISDIDSLVSQLEKGLGIGAIAKQLSSGAKVISNEVDMFNKLDEAREQLKTLKQTISEYDASYASFSGAVDSLIAHLKTTRPDPEKDEDGAKAWDTSASNLRSTANSAASLYAGSVQKVIDGLQSLHDKLGAVITQSNALLSQTAVFLADTNSALAQVDADVADKDAAAGYKNLITANSTLGSTAQSVSGSVSSTVETFSEASFVSAIASLQREKDAASVFSAGSISSGSAGLSSASYHSTDLAGFRDADSIDRLLDEMERGVDSEGGLDALFALFDIISSLFNTQLFYDSRLNSTLDVDYYNAAYGGLPSVRAAAAVPDFLKADEARAKAYLSEIDPNYNPDDPFGYGSTGMSKLERFANTMERFIRSLSDIKDSKKIKDKLKACGTAIESGASLLEQLSGLGAIIKQAVANVAQRQVLLGYLAYNLPNRTNFQSGSTLTGYSFGNAALAYERTGSNVPIVGAVAAVAAPYKNYAFVGAELEYILGGDGSEVANQMKVFFFLWVTRLFLDAIPVLMNGELQTILNGLSAIPVLGPVITLVGWIVVLAVEPLIDTYVLVNGSKAPLLKSKIYVSPSGIPDLVATLSNIALTQTTINTIRSKSQEWAGVEVTKPDSIEASKDKPLIDVDKWAGGLLDLDYTEHLLILMTLFADEPTCLRRLADMIQCEMTQRNRVNNTTIQQGVTGGYYDFNIDEAYTAVRVQATGSLVQVLPVPALSASSMFRFDRVIYRGY